MYIISSFHLFDLYKPSLNRFHPIRHSTSSILAIDVSGREPERRSQPHIKGRKVFFPTAKTETKTKRVTRAARWHESLKVFMEFFTLFLTVSKNFHHKSYVLFPSHDDLGSPRCAGCFISFYVWHEQISQVVNGCAEIVLVSGFRNYSYESFWNYHICKCRLVLDWFVSGGWVGWFEQCSCVACVSFKRTTMSGCCITIVYLDRYVAMIYVWY